MNAAQDNRLAELTQAANNADWSEMWHQKQCRARGAGLGCESCHVYAATVVETDRALGHYFSQLKEGAA